MRSSGLVYVVLVATLVALASTTPLKFEETLPVERTQQIYRLPTAVQPTHYAIFLVPNYETIDSGFTGNVTINVAVVDRTNAIIVHNDGLNIDTAATTVYSDTDEIALEIATQTYDPIRHFQIITFRSNLPLGNYTVSFSFSGNFATDMSGMYLSSYQVENETRWLVATQFQPTFARRVFLCFDEPGFKTTFDVSLAHFINQIALSNMPNISTSEPDTAIGGRVWTQFERTPIMSTYILAFIVSEFESQVSSDQFFGVWSRPEAIDTTSWALEATPNLYQIFLNLVRTEDPWPKIDQIAIPDFSAGAMENWGLITYRERLLLWKEGESSSINREQIASIICHELAHIWFGNLVSPVWWDHLWFSEGFASFYQYLVPSLTYPLWRYAERLVTEQQLPAMIADSLETTRPMTNVVGSPGSVLASFDNVAYSKSAAVFRMLNRIMREDLFTVAISNFLDESAHGVFEPSTLWSHMQVVADANAAVQNHIPIASIMESWTNQPGYPLVTVVRNYSTTVVAFRQERFFMNPNSPTANPDSQRWWIPITYTFGTAPAGCNSAWLQPDWLRAQDNAIMGNGVANTTWILANCQAIGFYRTNYDAQNWELLTEYLKNPDFQQINAMNRAVLIDDSLNLARAGYIEYPIALNLIAYLAQETDFVVWRAAITPITWLNRILATNEHFTYWQASLRVLVSNVYSSLGWTAAADDAHVTRIHRGQIVQLAAQLDHADARSAAEEIFNLWIADPQQNPVDPDLKSAVYCWGIRNATEATWDVVWGRFLATDLATEEHVLLSALGCSQNPAILEKYLQLSITPNSGIRSQDTSTVTNSILTSPQDNVDVLLNFIDNFSAAIAEFYGSMNAVTSMLTSISNRITTQAQLEKFRAIVTSAQLGADTVLIESVLRNAEGNLNWISNNVPVIVDWLREQGFIPVTEAPVPTTVPPTTTPAVTTPAVTTPAVTTPDVTTPVATTPVVTTETAPTESDSGATVFTSSLYFLFSSLALVMSNYLAA